MTGFGCSYTPSIGLKRASSKTTDFFAGYVDSDSSSNLRSSDITLYETRHRGRDVAKCHCASLTWVYINEYVITSFMT